VGTILVGVKLGTGVGVVSGDEVSITRLHEAVNMPSNKAEKTTALKIFFMSILLRPIRCSPKEDGFLLTNKRQTAGTFCYFLA
jgi:hypothetical protein